MDFEKQKKLVCDTFTNLGFKILYFNNKLNTNGVDLFVQKDYNKPLSVEIKVLRKMVNKGYQIAPVSKPRMLDDLIAIIINEKYVLVESMADHLRCCSKLGTRNITILGK